MGDWSWTILVGGIAFYAGVKWLEVELNRWNTGRASTAALDFAKEEGIQNEFSYACRTGAVVVDRNSRRILFARPDGSAKWYDFHSYKTGVHLGFHKGDLVMQHRGFDAEEQFRFKGPHKALMDLERRLSVLY